MKRFDKIERMLEDELEKISTQEKLTTTALEVGDKAAHFLKSIKTIEAMEDAEGGESYGDSYGMSYESDYSYARNGRGRGSRAKRDSRGRYSSENGGMMSQRGGGYSGNRQGLMMELEDLKNRIDQMED